MLGFDRFFNFHIDWMEWTRYDIHWQNYFFHFPKPSLEFPRVWNISQSNVSHLFLIGKDALAIKKIFAKLNNLKISICNDLVVAVTEAFDRATEGDIILLSPSCSSHDMYQNYIERGEHFNKIVRSLKN